MKRKGLLFAALMASLVSGCVWSTDYKAKLAEIDGLQKSAVVLEQQGKARDKEIAGLTQQVSDLTSEKEQLEKENANIKSTLESSRSQLTRDVVELKNKLNDNTSRIKMLENELAEKNREIFQLRVHAEKLAQEKEKAIAGMKDTYESLVNELKQEIKEGEVQITQLKDKLTVNMVEKILFDSGSAVIKKNGKKVLERVADILKNVSGHQIKIEGHTDNVPIGAAIIGKFPTNWELSTSRATTVVRYLQERGVDPKVMSAEGYAEFRPVAPNDTDEGKSKNRRIEIVLVPLDASR